jgi:CRP/FNR family transcriptional regulator, dissimilatory nitrate respiration regulator
MIMEKKWLKVLKISPVFEGIDIETLNTMFQCMKPTVHSYRKNSFVTTAGEKVDGLGILLSGQASVIKESVSGYRIMMVKLEPGGMFGEMVVFSARGVWPASVQAHSDCTVMFLPPEKFYGECENLCASHRQMISNMLRIISERALMLNRKVEYLAIRNMRGKISTYLLEQYKRTGKDTFMLPLKRNELADFLNVSRTALSREMGRMRDEGLIEFHMASVRICQVEALKKCPNNKG